MSNKIQLKRGTTSPGTILDVGEPGYDSWNKILYVGNGIGQQPTKYDLSQIISNLALNTSDGKLDITMGNGSTIKKDLLNGTVTQNETRGVTGENIYTAINNSISNASEIYVGSSAPIATSYKVWIKTSDSSFTIFAKNGNTWVEATAISGVYVGSGNMPAGYNVQIDPTGEAYEVVTREEFDALAARVTALGG